MAARININNQGLVIGARLRLAAPALTAIAMFAAHILLLAVLGGIIALLPARADTYEYTLVLLLGVGPVFGMLLSATAVRDETSPNASGFVKAAWTAALVTVVALALALVLAVVAASYADVSPQLAVWHWLWVAGLAVSLAVTIWLILRIRAYRRAYERNLRDACREAVVPILPVGSEYVTHKWAGGSDE